MSGEELESVIILQVVHFPINYKFYQASTLNRRWYTGVCNWRTCIELGCYCQHCGGVFACDPHHYWPVMLSGESGRTTDVDMWEDTRQ